jgi:hypothetical protein
MAKEVEPPERFHISTSQVFASSLAAVSAAIVCSYFGVAGTVIGTAITSFVATVGSALYSFSLRRTRTRLRQLHRAGAASPPVAEVLKTMRQQGRHLLDRTQWLSLALGVGAVFVFAIGVITAIEDATSIGTTPLRAPHHPHHSTPTTTETPTPPTSPTGTPTPTATATATSTTRPSRTPSSSASPSGTPSEMPMPTVTPTLTPPTTLAPSTSPSVDTAPS